MSFTTGLDSSGGMIRTATTATARSANTHFQLWSPPDEPCPSGPPDAGPPVPPGVGRPERRSGREGGLITPWYAPRPPAMHAWGGIVSRQVIANLRLMASIAPGSNEAEPTHGATPAVPASAPSSPGPHPPTPGSPRYPTAGYPPSPGHPAHPESPIIGPREG